MLADFERTRLGLDASTDPLPYTCTHGTDLYHINVVGQGNINTLLRHFETCHHDMQVRICNIRRIELQSQLIRRFTHDAITHCYRLARNVIL